MPPRRKFGIGAALFEFNAKISRPNDEILQPEGGDYTTGRERKSPTLVVKDGPTLVPGGGGGGGGGGNNSHPFCDEKSISIIAGACSWHPDFRDAIAHYLSLMCNKLWTDGCLDQLKTFNNSKLKALVDCLKNRPWDFVIFECSDDVNALWAAQTISSPITIQLSRRAFLPRNIDFLDRVLFHELVHACATKLGIEMNELDAKILETLCYGHNPRFPIWSENTICRICAEAARYPKTLSFEVTRSSLFAWHQGWGNVVVIDDAGKFDMFIGPSVKFGLNAQNPKEPFNFASDYATHFWCSSATEADWLAYDPLDPNSKCPLVP